MRHKEPNVKEARKNILTSVFAQIEYMKNIRSHKNNIYDQALIDSLEALLNAYLETLPPSYREHT